MLRGWSVNAFLTGQHSIPQHSLPSVIGKGLITMENKCIQGWYKMGIVGRASERESERHTRDWSSVCCWVLFFCVRPNRLFTAFRCKWIEKLLSAGWTILKGHFSSARRGDFVFCWERKGLEKPSTVVFSTTYYSALPRAYPLFAAGLK